MITISEVDEFHRLGKVAHSRITPEQSERFEQLWEMAYGKPTTLTDDEMKNRIEGKPLDLNVEECLSKISKIYIGKSIHHSYAGPDLEKYPERVYEVYVNSKSEDGICVEICHELIHVLHDDLSGDGSHHPDKEEIIDSHAKLICKKQPNLAHYILTRLSDSGKLVRR